MKRYLLILSSMILFCMTSCKEDKSVSFGTVEYYPDFLWVDSCVTPVTKTFEFNFSQDAKDYNSYAEFQFVDNEGKPISTSVMQVSIEGKEIANNSFLVRSDESSKELLFTFSPAAEKGKHQGYLKLIKHNLDRLDSQPLTPGQQVDAFQWTLYFDKVMNPLAKVLMWIGIIFVFLSFLWLLILKRIFFPRIRVNRIDISSRDGYNVNKNINGARKIIVTDDYKPQNWLNKQITGRIIYIKNDRWKYAWELTPKGKKLKIHLHGHYMINPIVSELVVNAKYQITNTVSNELTTITIL